MGKFQLEINVEPKDIPGLDDVHKRDCADALNKAVNSVFKYTLVFSLAVMAFFGIYSIFGSVYLMRMGKMLPQINIAVPLFAAAIFILEFIAGTMNKTVLIIEVILNIVLIFAAIIDIPAVWIAPFALYAAVLHIKLITFIPFHKVLTEQAGYPEFTPLPVKDGGAVERTDTSENDTE